MVRWQARLGGSAEAGVATATVIPGGGPAGQVRYLAPGLKPDAPPGACGAGQTVPAIRPGHADHRTGRLWGS
jgi:hypothetical protein